MLPMICGHLKPAFDSTGTFLVMFLHANSQKAFPCLCVGDTLLADATYCWHHVCNESSFTCRWKATALRQGDWASWFQTQMKTANKKPEKGLYISLRMDGRVRGSGTGSPPWDRLAVALPPVSGEQCMTLILHGFLLSST